MFLNSIQPALGSRKIAKRVGRGIGSTDGKTCGRGHKGQKARAGGFHKVGFEGGQMPLQRRLPKVGFTSKLKKFSTEVTLGQLNNLSLDLVSLDTLIAANLVPVFVNKVKIINTGSLKKAVIVKGLAVTEAAKQAIEVAGGRVEA